MKIFVGILLSLVVLVSTSVFIIAANTSRNCYIAAQKDLDASAFQSNAYPDSKGVQCTASYNTIITLGSCIDGAHALVPAFARSQLVPLVDRTVSWIRYGSNDAAALRVSHDGDCEQYPDAMFIPPDLIGK
jgi:hypothetical protein